MYSTIHWLALARPICPVVLHSPFLVGPRPGLFVQLSFIVHVSCLILPTSFSALIYTSILHYSSEYLLFDLI